MLTFLHTSPIHIPRFTQLLNQIDPTIPAQHFIYEDILARIQDAGSITPAIQAELKKIVADMVASSAHILCTCSTIGGLVESFADENVTILRVDRPMAERAVALGEKIVVLATFASTLEPTCALIRSVLPSEKSIQLETVICEGAWDYFLQDDMARYYQRIAEVIGTVEGDVIVLAQASMLGEVDYADYTPIPILSSPQLGVAAIVKTYRAKNSV